ncbi:hypothetical protein ABZY68_20280 [Streptomyces sp. NPDC006482]|uniref:hypothetical protein n=1 Tax=Streptomyces sp. NPDC006482 TaxID=3154306 RepID=UPI0033A19897
MTHDANADDAPAHAPDADGAKPFAAGVRQPLHRRVLRLAVLIPFAVGVLLLFSHLLGWTALVEVTPGRAAFWVGIAAATAVLERRRGAPGLGKEWLLGFVVGVPAWAVAEWLAGSEPLFRIALWGSVLLTLPGLVCLVVEHRRGPSDPEIAGVPPQRDLPAIP